MMTDPLCESEARYARLKLLYECSKAIHSKLDWHAALQAALNHAMQAARASGGAVALLNPTTGCLEIEVSHGLWPDGLNRKLRVGEGIEGHVARTGKSERIADLLRDARHVGPVAGLRSFLAVPLAVNSEIRGVVSVVSEETDRFAEADGSLLEEIATLAAEATQHTWVYEQFRLKARLFESLAKVSRTINSTLSLGEALEVVVREARALMQVKMASLMMLDEASEWLDLQASSGAGEAYLKKPRLSVSDSLLGGVIRRRRPLQEQNVQTSSRYQNVDVACQEGLVSLLSVPLVFAGKAIGTLSVYTSEPYTFSNAEIQILSALADLSAIAIEKARLYERAVDVEEQLRQKEKLSALGWLAAEVAHEIRNPLTVMKMLYHSLDLKFPDGDPRVKDARLISQKIDHLNKFVERILDFAKTSEPQFGLVDLNGLIEELVLLVRHKLQQQQIRLTLTLEADLPLIRGDARQLEQAFLNIVLNAAEAMPNGGALTIVTETRSGKCGVVGHDSVAIRFLDTGHGMRRKRFKNHIKSVLKSSKSHGTGLGLAIVTRVVESHKGVVTIKSELGVGTCVDAVFHKP